MGEPNRKRKVQILFRVTQQEKDLIQQKMDFLGMDNFSKYAREMMRKGYIINVDTSELQNLAAELQKIDINLRQILRYVDTLGALYAADAAELRVKIQDCWNMVRQLFREAAKYSKT